MTNQEGILWPTMLLVGSLTNVAGMTYAIAHGDANNSVAFRTGLFASIVYSTSHAIKVFQVAKKNWAEKVIEEKELNQIDIDRV